MAFASITMVIMLYFEIGPFSPTPGMVAPSGPCRYRPGLKVLGAGVGVADTVGDFGLDCMCWLCPGHTRALSTYQGSSSADENVLETPSLLGSSAAHLAHRAQA